jgi:hypothetical protein
MVAQTPHRPPVRGLAGGTHPAHYSTMLRMTTPTTLLAVLLCAAAMAAPAQTIEVKVQTHGETVVVDVSANVAARRAIVFAVLTDYEHMAEYVSSLTSSAVLARSGNVLEVEQHGKTSVGPFHFSFWSVRAVELIGDREVRSQLLRGDFKSYEFATQVGPGPAGTMTITHHGEYVPKAWIPPIVGRSRIEAGVRRQYEELIAEMIRREAKEAPGASPR